MISFVRICGNQSLKRFLSFTNLGVRSELVHQLNGLNIVKPTVIQEKSIPLQLNNVYPLALSSETGSGKTLAYLLPYLHDYMNNANKRLIVLTPRKELAYQFDAVLHQLVPSISSSVLVGKSPVDKHDTNRIERGVFPNVIVGTAIPVHEYIRKAFRGCDVELLAMSQHQISRLVLDEADVLLNDPFKWKVLESVHILQKINSDLKVIAAGATLPRNGRRTAGGVLESEFPNITWIEGSYQNSIPDTISVEFLERKNNEEKLIALMDLIPRLEGIPSLIFVRNAKECKEVADRLKRSSLKVQTISQDDTQEQRKKGVQLVLKGSPLCTVCTDMLSRGVDTTRIKMVIQYDFARDITTFLHRCGRTGRNGEKGSVICMVTPENDLLYRRILECGVHNDLSSLYSRKRLLRKKEKKQAHVL